MALSEPFQCSNWKTVISSWNSSMVRPLLASSMKRKAPMPVLGLSASSGSPCNTTKTEDVSKKKNKQKQHKKYRVSRSFQYQFYRFVKLSDSPPPPALFFAPYSFGHCCQVSWEHGNDIAEEESWVHRLVAALSQLHLGLHLKTSSGKKRRDPNPWKRWRFFIQRTQTMGGKEIRCQNIDIQKTVNGKYLEWGSGFGDGFLDKVVRDLSRRVFVEDGIHQGDFGSAPSRLGFRRAILWRKKKQSTLEINKQTHQYGVKRKKWYSIGSFYAAMTESCCIIGGTHTHTDPPFFLLLLPTLGKQPDRD